MAEVAVNSPGLSIVIPALNEAGTISRTLDSLQAMRRRGHEVIVVDGGSEDETVAVCSSLADHVIEAPRGRANQMRAGASVASGSVIWFLHADTVPVESADQLIQEKLAQPAFCWGHFDIHFLDGGSMMKVIAFFMNMRARITGISTGDQGLFITRVLYDKVGGMPAIPLMEDIALCRVLNRYKRPVILREKLVSSPRRWEKQGVIQTILMMWMLRFAFYCGVKPARLARYYAVNNA